MKTRFEQVARWQVACGQGAKGFVCRPAVLAAVRACSLALILPMPLVAQDQSGVSAQRGPVVPSQIVSGDDVLEQAADILVLDFDQFYSSSAYSRRVDAEIKAETQIIRAENAKIVEQLEMEERRLTALRATLSPDEFQQKAREFDERVEELRAAPLAKERALLERQTRARQVFLQAAQPILQQIMGESGASVIIDRRNVIMHSSAIDITRLAITRTDAALEGEIDASDLTGTDGQDETGQGDAAQE